ncbi:DUF2339 domain-containing protein [Candidatus Hydrogenedentota bacterium]
MVSRHSSQRPVHIAYATLARRLMTDLKQTPNALLKSVFAAIGLLLLYALFLCEKGALQNYITFCWGISAIAVLITGLLDRSKPLRIIGMVGLAVCIPRVFIVDVRETLYRIVASIALAVVLLTVGFLYTKYKDQILPEEDA